MSGKRLVRTQLEPKFIGRNGVLVQADCLDLLANIKTDSIDLIFLDPTSQTSTTAFILSFTKASVARGYLNVFVFFAQAARYFCTIFQYG
jgi:hypothetical protein